MSSNVSVKTEVQSNTGPNVMDIRTALNTCKSTSPAYTRIADLREECPYPISTMERVKTPFGETVMVILEGQYGDDLYLRVYLPRHLNQALSDADLDRYNAGYGERLHLIKHSPQPGSKFTPLEFL